MGEIMFLAVAVLGGGGLWMKHFIEKDRGPLIVLGGPVLIGICAAAVLVLLDAR